MIIPKINISDKLEISRLVHGHWRLSEWGMTSGELLKLVEQLLECGITTFDHADIYGDYTCEKLFGDALQMNKSIRDRIQIITKCGIKLMTGKYPDRVIKSYDYSYEHVISSVEQSLKNFQTDYIDLLLLHRPAPFFDPAEVAKAMEYLHSTGKVLHFGVSNFSPLQYDMMQKYSPFKLVTNQVEISPFCLEHFDNGNIDYFLKEGIHPMAWSPLAGGSIFRHTGEKGVRLLDEIRAVAKELDAAALEEVIYAWLLLHPVKMIPIIGSGKIERIQHAINSFDINMDQEQWYRIFNASRGKELD